MAYTLELSMKSSCTLSGFNFRARVADEMKGGVRMSDYMFLDENFEESLLIEDDIKEAENPCDGCAIIMGDDPCTVCPYQTAEVAAAIERRHNQ